jgi:hypothetical protein
MHSAREPPWSPAPRCASLHTAPSCTCGPGQEHDRGRAGPAPGPPERSGSSGSEPEHERWPRSAARHAPQQGLKPSGGCESRRRPSVAWRWRTVGAHNRLYIASCAHRLCATADTPNCAVPHTRGRRIPYRRRWAGRVSQAVRHVPGPLLKPTRAPRRLSYFMASPHSPFLPICALALDLPGRGLSASGGFDQAQERAGLCRGCWNVSLECVITRHQYRRRTRPQAKPSVRRSDGCAPLSALLARGAPLAVASGAPLTACGCSSRCRGGDGGSAPRGCRRERQQALRQPCPHHRRRTPRAVGQRPGPGWPCAEGKGSGGGPPRQRVVAAAGESAGRAVLAAFVRAANRAPALSLHRGGPLLLAQHISVNFSRFQHLSAPISRKIC